MWQHTIAQMVAEELDASMYIKTIYGDIPGSAETYWAPNTVVGGQTVSALLPAELFWNNLPVDHPHRVLCENKNISFYTRSKDTRERNNVASAELSIT